MRSFTIVIVLLVTTGCAAQHHFEWSSDQGEKCFYTCKAKWSECKSRCVNIFGLQACDDSEFYCMKACPDLKQIR